MLLSVYPQLYAESARTYHKKTFHLFAAKWQEEYCSFTSNCKLVNITTKTGWYLLEAVHQYYALRDKDIQVDFVSEKGWQAAH